MLEQIDPDPIWKRSTRANPHPLYEELRRETPVYRTIGPVSGNTVWILTRYEDCVNALKDQRFGKELWKKLTPEQYAPFGTPPTPDDPFEVINYHLLNIDPPDHTRLRALVHKAFTPRMVENLRPRIQQIADDLLDAMADKGEADLIEDYAFPLPITVIAEMLGVPVEDRERFREWTKALLFGDDPDKAKTSVMEFMMYMHQKIDERQTAPRDDVLSALVNAEESGDTLNRQELLSMIFLLLVAGHETTVNLIGNGTLALLQNPDQLAKLQAEPTLINNAVEEMLRYNGPVEVTTTRWSFEDVPVGDTVIPVGEVVLVSLLAANRDPAVFDDPHTFDITRDFTHKKHIAFGAGIHYCVGAPLARLEGALAINALVQRLPRLELAVPLEDLRWNETLLLHGMKTMPVRF